MTFAGRSVAAAKLEPENLGVDRHWNSADIKIVVVLASRQEWLRSS